MKNEDADRTNLVAAAALDRLDKVQKPAALDRIIPATAPAGPFRNIHQGKATNALARINKTVTDPAQIDLYGNVTITKTDFKLFISKYNELTGGVKQTSMRLLDALVEAVAETGQREPLVKIPLADYMEKRGLKDVKEARRQVKSDMEALTRLKMEFKEKGHGKAQGDFLTVTLAGGTHGIVKGTILFRFNQDFFEVIKKYPVMPYPQEIYRLNPHRNPNSAYFLRKIAEHKNMNIGKSNENTISVKTLLESTTELPKYEDIANKGQVDQRIIRPFTRDMDAITSFRWHYCGKNGAQIEEPDTYADFEQRLIHIEWQEYPDQTKRLETKKKRVAASKRKKQKGGDQGSLFNTVIKT